MDFLQIAKKPTQSVRHTFHRSREVYIRNLFKHFPWMLFQHRTEFFRDGETRHPVPLYYREKLLRGAHALGDVQSQCSVFVLSQFITVILHFYTFLNCNILVGLLPAGNRRFPTPGFDCSHRDPCHRVVLPAPGCCRFRTARCMYASKSPCKMPPGNTP